MSHAKEGIIRRRKGQTRAHFVPMERSPVERERQASVTVPLVCVLLFATITVIMV